jgi:hypothetical protein
MSRRYSFSVVAVLAFVLVLVGQSGAVAAPRSIVNDNPIDWTIVTPFRGALGDDLPLRVGQEDLWRSGDDLPVGIVSAYFKAPDFDE